MVNPMLSIKLGMVKANYTDHHYPIIKYPYITQLGKVWIKTGVHKLSKNLGETSKF
jgi:hypothetical protein